MNFHELLERRSSCRHYLDKPVPRDVLEAIMKDGAVSPSATNAQRWMFIAVDDPEKKERLADTMYDRETGINKFASNVPAFIALVKHPIRNPNGLQVPMLKEEPWAEIDLGIAAYGMCLSATNRGIGSVVIGLYDQQVVQEVLDLPEELEVAIFIGLGYPLHDGIRKKMRLDSTEVIRYDSYNNSEK